MAGDTRVTVNGDTAMQTQSKIARHRGALYGCAGDADAIAEFFALLREGRAWAWLSDWGRKGPSFECLVLARDGLYYMEQNLVKGEPLGEPQYAIGSGGDAARGAMRMRATPRQAVHVAAAIDPFTGGKVRVYSLY